MNTFEQFLRLAGHARRESVPPLDVVPGVLGRIRHRAASARTHPVDRLLLAASVVSAMAATVMAVLAVEAWEMFTDPVAGLLPSLTMVFP